MRMPGTALKHPCGAGNACRVGFCVFRVAASVFDLTYARVARFDGKKSDVARAAATLCGLLACMLHGTAMAGDEVRDWQAVSGLSLRLSPQVGALTDGQSGGQTGGQARALQALTWPQALALAEQQAPPVRAAMAQADAQSGVARQAWAQAYMPRLDLSAVAQQDRVQTPYDQTRQPSASVGLQASMPLWHGADRAMERAQQALAQRAQWQARLTRMDVAREVSRSYLMAVDAATQLELLEAQRKLLTAQLQINEQRLRGGVGTSLERLETATRLDQLRVELHERRTRDASLRLTLARWLSCEVAAVGRLSAHALLDEAAAPLVVPPLNEALAEVGAHSPAVQDAQAQVRAAQADLQARDAEAWHPSVDAVASVNRARQITKTTFGNESLSYTESTLGVQLNMPLYSGGRQPARQATSSALLTKAQADYDEALARAQGGLLDAYQGLAQARSQVRALRDMEASAHATLEALQRAFVAGLRSNLDLLNAQQQLIATRSQSVTARLNVLLAQVDILSLTERLDAATIAPLSGLLVQPPLDSLIAMKDDR